ncbi:acetamidase/formamidase family protein [Natronobacterium gregoryi]|uniref:Acetamidase n=2 Tax=Natronobacterium gregoryi TaxID=44930 RepID=L0AEE9_NATGS|nr:acetamidase/formamidase family protein [Natronobacterium gregoryi]AFZ71517.1 putative acetamidase/formamidase [Natronobacterium gregoryi SP2]ELY66575.1 formamidase [Natronobacterium gregoryi SP2]PLK21292.1 acetamidase [Natronobacterium gregoryi SP2]SFI82956.1 Acetamidase/formamidase [Natronobacterium gregoryi]
MSIEYDEVDHRVSATDDAVHSDWDNSREPIRTVESGDVVEFECRDATNGQIDPDSTVADLADLDVGQVHTLTGPIAMEDAEPGDVLQVDVLDLEHQGWGYTLVLPGELGMGLLPEEFPEPALHVWEFEDDAAHFVDSVASETQREDGSAEGGSVDGIEVPLHPFPGTVGVAPAADGQHDTNPPRPVGGNLDIKQLTAGSTLYLPIAVADALFSIGDCHAAQGDGEVCISAIEAPMSVTCRLEVQPEMGLERPQFETDGPFTPTGRDEPAFGTTGIGDDLSEAARDAVRGMIDHLHEERGLEREQAYVLCSAAVDLKINQIVNAPNWTVSAYLPESIFPEG